MTTNAETDEILRVSPWDVLLDPNSYRLIDDPLWEQVPDEDIPTAERQGEAFESVMRESRYGMRDLRSSLEAHGWLDIEPLWVRRLPDGHLVVVDGNRRLVAWRMLLQPNGRQASLFPPESFAEKIEVHVIGEPTSRDSSLALGLRHRIPPTSWPPLGAAVWQERHHLAYGEWPDEKRVRLNSRWHRESEMLALDLTRRFGAEHGNMGDQSGIYRLLVEALSDRRISAWLRVEGKQVNRARLSRFFSWLVPRGETEQVSDESEIPARSRPPIRGMDIRQLGSVIDQPEVLARLDLGEPLELARSRSLVVLDEPENHLHPWVLTQLARNRPIDPTRAQNALGMLRVAIEQAGEEPVEPGTDHPWPLLAPEAPVFLQSLALNRFRGLNGVGLSDLGRINLFVGVNNAGKTSILEALYILSRLSDPRGLLDTLRIRTRQDPERNPGWLCKLIEPLSIDISAVDASGQSLSLRMTRPSAPEHVDLATYLPGLQMEAAVGGARHATRTDLFSNRSRRTVQIEGRSAWLAPVVMHSPFAGLDRGALVRCYEASVLSDSLSLILETLKSSLDPGIKDIKQVSDTGRFLVEHTDAAPMELVNYGEGLQRVFEIGLLFAAHENGFVLIDEMETAIHTSALGPFSEMVQRLAVRFNVQVFITTHSKETVDAFLFNEYRTEDVVAYLLKREDKERIRIRRFGGLSLKRATEVGDIDLRRL